MAVSTLSLLQTVHGCRWMSRPMRLLAGLAVSLAMSGCVAGLLLPDCEAYAGRGVDVTALALSASGELLAGGREAHLSGCMVGIGLPTPVLYRSGDRGSSWQRLPLPHAGRAIDVQVVSIASRGDATLFAVVATLRQSLTDLAGTWDGRIYRSRDGGANWQEVAHPGGSAFVSSIAVGSGKNVFVYVNGTGVFRSGDDGDHWTFTGLRHPDSDPRRLHYRNFKVYAHPNAGVYAYAEGAAGEGFYRSTDEGLTWQRLPIEAGHFHRLAIGSGGEVAISLPQGLASSTIVHSPDGGRTWQRKTDLDRSSVLALGLHGRNDLYLLTLSLIHGDELWRSRDAGVTWQKGSMDLPGRSVHEVGAFLVGADGALYVGLAGQRHKTPPVVFGGTIYRSTDHGTSWSRVRLLEPR